MKRLLIVLEFSLIFLLFPALALRGEDKNSGASPYFEVLGESGALDSLPLKSVDTSIEIVGTLAQVEMVQTYANVAAETIEAIYVFPGSTRAAVNALEMRLGDRRVVAEIKEREWLGACTRERKRRARRRACWSSIAPTFFK